MPRDFENELSRRERQIMDAIYRLGEASAAEVARTLDDAAGQNSVRVTLSILEKKGFLLHRQDGPRYVYRPTVATDKARRSAMRHVLKTFFSGSPSAAILSLLDGTARLSQQELDDIAQAISQARKQEE
ncbi:MAG TPA: BlaI/MecI/CopY family transcriptional regulator [Gemmatimonadales bacterium]|jgi:predicted transcriptional regulator